MKLTLDQQLEAAGVLVAIVTLSWIVGSDIRKRRIEMARERRVAEQERETAEQTRATNRVVRRAAAAANNREINYLMMSAERAATILENTRLGFATDMKKQLIRGFVSQKELSEVREAITINTKPDDIINSELRRAARRFDVCLDQAPRQRELVHVDKTAREMADYFGVWTSEVRAFGELFRAGLVDLDQEDHD